MFLFSTLILFAWIIIIGLNIKFSIPIYNFTTWQIIFSVVIGTFVIIAIDGLTAIFIRLLPKKWFNPFSNRFKVFKWEKAIYHKFGIKKWKELIPEFGHFTSVRKNKIKEPNNNTYLEKYLVELCYGRVVHFVSFFTGFFVIYLYPLKYWMCFALPIALVNIILNFMCLIVLRYNTPKVMAVYNYNLKLQNKKE